VYANKKMLRCTGYAVQNPEIVSRILYKVHASS
jgi:hypothetical protein